MATMHPQAASRLSKAEQYARITEEILAVLDGEPDRVARMATVAAMLAAEFRIFLWTGFYSVDVSRPEELVIGPYQGSLGCLRIAFSRGVCGATARARATVIVDDVETFDGHIACDSRSRSEIVVPVFDPQGDLIAVLDIDSERLSAFDAVDAAGLETLVRRVFGA
jgi:GAF domain-containing protein